MRKRTSFLPVTALAWSPDGALLYAGVGSRLLVIDGRRGGDPVAEIETLPSRVVHGVRVWGEGLIVYGNKELCVVVGGEVQATLHLPDLVLDARRLLPSAAVGHRATVVAVALAHNTVDVWDWATGERLSTVQCDSRCLLYASALRGDSFESLQAASGTVFNQVLLWRPAEGGGVRQRLVGHGGVVFHCQWSEDGSRLASVSDDRTVRVWRTADGEQLMAGWGHRSRVWTAHFVDLGAARGGWGVVTTGEDATVRLWSQKGEELAVLEGHRDVSVWSCAVHPSHPTLASGGNDSGIQLWSLGVALAEQALDPVLLPPARPREREEDDEEEDEEEEGEEQEESKGEVPEVDAKEEEEEEEEEEVLLLLPGIDTTTDIAPVRESQKRKRPKTKVKAGPEHSARYVEINGDGTTLLGSRTGYLWRFAVGDAAQPELWEEVTRLADAVVCGCFHPRSSRVAAGCSSGEIFVEGVGTWGAHRSRIVALCWADTDLLVSTDAAGGAKLWRLLGEGQEPRLIRAVRKRGGMFVSAVRCLQHPDLVHLGFSKGHVVSVSTAEGGEEEEEGEVTGVNQHGGQSVSCLVEHRGRLFSGGHDGFVSEYRCEASGAVSRLRQLRIPLIAAVARLQWTPIDDRLIVFGFRFKEALVVDVERRRVCVRFVCGGWRRPVHAVVHVGHPLLPSSAVFQPQGGTGMSVSLLDQRRSTAEWEFGDPQLRRPLVGKTTNCISWCDQAPWGHDLLVVAGESALVQLVDVTTHQVTWLGEHEVCVRGVAVCAVADGSQLLVVTVGGKQTLNTYLLRPPLHGGQLADAELLGSHVGARLDLDRRSICVDLLPQADGSVLAAAGTDGGCVEFLQVFPSVRLIGTADLPSGKPVLCVTALGASTVACGATDGQVTLFDVQSCAVVGEYRAHFMGVNAITSPAPGVLVSGGDDQALCFWKASCPGGSQGSPVRVEGASGSSIKGIQRCGDVGERRLVATGSDQRLNEWQATEAWDGAAMVNACVTEVADALALSASTPSATRPTVRVAVAGEGVQLVDLSPLPPVPPLTPSATLAAELSPLPPVPPLA